MSTDSRKPADAPDAEGRLAPAIDRRSFLKRSGATAMGLSTMGLGAMGLASDAAGEDRRPTAVAIKRYRKLGKTGLEISDIGFGSGGCKSPDLVRYCFDRGMNYFDTAEMYRTEGRHKDEYVESMIGEALAGKRDKAVITTKYMAEANHSRQHIMKQLEASLRRLRTDYVDIFLNHAVNNVARLKNPEWSEFVELAKKQGKIRFSGMSGHGGNLQECLDYALDQKMVDVILCSHNFGSDPAFYERFTKHFDMIANQKGLPKYFKKAHDQGVGVIVMKTVMGSRVNDLTKYRKDGAKLPKAAFRWVFSDPNVDGLIISMKNKLFANYYISCSGDAQFTQQDANVLEYYVAENSSDYCRPACDTCESSCPYGVPIADVLRQRMYHERYDNPRMARQGYARIAGRAAACEQCTDQPCLNACPYDLEIPKLTRETRKRLHRT